MEIKWRSLKNDPPPKDAKGFWVGHSKRGRMEYVFPWPNPKTGKLAYWQKDPNGGNVMLTAFKPNVWYPGPPSIPGSWVDRLQKGEFD